LSIGRVGSYLTLYFRVRLCLGTALRVRLPPLLPARSALELVEAPLDRRESLGQPARLLAVGELQLGEGVGESGSCLLAAAREIVAGGVAPAAHPFAGGLAATNDLVAGGGAAAAELGAGALAAPSDLVEQIASTLPGVRRRPRRRRERAGNGRPQRFADPLAACSGLVGARFRLLI
jgi:hypothetical protein